MQRPIIEAEAAAPPASLAYWQVAPPPGRPDELRPLRSFAGRFFPATQLGAPEDRVLVHDGTDPDGTFVRRIEDHRGVWAEERWSNQVGGLTFAAMADQPAPACRSGLFEGEPGGPAAPGRLGPSDQATVVAGLVEWVRAHDGRPLTARVELAAPSAIGDAHSITVWAANSPAGTIEFRPEEAGLPVGTAIAMRACGRPAARVGAGSGR